MAITVNFRTSKGNVTSRQFKINEGVSVYGKVTGVIMPEPGTHIRMEIIDSRNNAIFFKETLANIWGNYDFWFRTPPNNERLKIILIATYSITGQDRVEIPIGVGNVFASPAPSPETEMSWLTMIPLLVGAVGVIYIMKVINE